MTKKNIRPQQVAPVERETISTAKDQSGQVTAQKIGLYGQWIPGEWSDPERGIPFAGDDAE